MFEFSIKTMKEFQGAPIFRDYLVMAFVRGEKGKPDTLVVAEDDQAPKITFQRVAEEDRVWMYAAGPLPTLIGTEVVITVNYF